MSVLGQALPDFHRRWPGNPHRALHWQSAGDQVIVVCYKARGEYADGEDPLSAEDERRLPRLYPGLEFSWRFGDPTFGHPAAGDDSHVPQLARFLKALWTISAQRVATVTRVFPDRPACRRAERAQLLTDGLVQVVQLRRPVSAPPANRADGAAVGGVTAGS